MAGALFRMSNDRILIDCSATAGSAAHTGIQRVVRNIVASARSLAGESGVDCLPVAFDGRRYRELPPDALLPAGGDGGERRGGAPSNVAAWLRSGPSAAMPKRRSGRWLGRLRAMLDALLLTGILRLAAASVRNMQSRIRPRSWPGSEAIGYRSGDWLLLIDSNWSSDLRRELHRAKRAGARVCVVVYDLIQLRRPDLASPGAGAIYRRWFVRTVPLADRILAISRTVLGDVRQQLRARAMPDPVAGSDYFYLGFDLDHPDGPGAVSEPARAAFAAGAAACFLVVGSVEPRKCHDVVLDAFEACWRDGSTSRLVLVGREAWHGGAVARRLRGHAEFGHRLFWLQDAGDADLEYAYSHATGLVFASIEEGFGLPIVEALQRGLPVLASDIPVFREIGGRHVAYFPAGDARTLAREVRAAERIRRFAGADPIEGFSWLSWRDAARELLAKLRI